MAEKDHHWQLVCKPKPVELFRDISAHPDDLAELLEKAEAHKGYVALYVVGEPDPDGYDDMDRITIGTAQSPAEIFKTGQRWNSRVLNVHMVAWTPGKIWADKLKKAVEKELEVYSIRGSWYNLPPAMIVNTVIMCAQTIKTGAFELFNDQQRYVKYGGEIREYIEKRGKQAKILPFYGFVGKR